MRGDINPVVYLEGSGKPVNYRDIKFEITYEPLWSDGRMDGSFMPKQIGAIPNPPEGTITLLNGDVISFSAIDELSDGTLIIKQPYYTVEWTRRIEL